MFSRRITMFWGRTVDGRFGSASPSSACWTTRMGSLAPAGPRVAGRWLYSMERLKGAADFAGPECKACLTESTGCDDAINQIIDQWSKASLLQYACNIQAGM